MLASPVLSPRKSATSEGFHEAIRSESSSVYDCTRVDPSWLRRDDFNYLTAQRLSTMIFQFSLNLPLTAGTFWKSNVACHCLRHAAPRANLMSLHTPTLISTRRDFPVAIINYRINGKDYFHCASSCFVHKNLGIGSITGRRM